MKGHYTHISVVLDRTGSMESIRDDVIGGYNAFLREQKDQPGIATLTLVQFDSQDPYEVIHQFEPIANLQGLSRQTYVPRASTPLLDAIGRGINDLEKRIGDLPEEYRPEKVVVVIITDGQENASKEFRKERIVEMIRDKRQRYGWQFVFLSADIDSIQDAVEYGFHGASTIRFDKSSRGSTEIWNSFSRSMNDYRADLRKDVVFTEKDREIQRRLEKKNRK